MNFAESLAPYAQAKEWIAGHPRLRYLFFELTDRCNLRCRHCGSSCPTLDSHQNADLDALKRVVDEVAEHTQQKEVLFCITGGEPLLWEHLEELGTYIKDKGYYWGLTTNATLITPDTVEMLARSGMKTVAISLDGLKDNHEWLRRTPGCFDRAVEGIRLLLESKKFVCVQAVTVVSPRNIGQLEELYQYLLDLGIDSWKLTGVEPIGNASDNPELFLSGEQHRQLLDFILEKRLEKKIEVSFGCSHFLPEVYETKVRTARFHCGSGIFIASISAKGEILGCLDIDRRDLTCQGNIRTDSFWDVWTNRFQLFRTLRPRDNGTCDNCVYHSYCRGDSWHTWDFDTNSPKICMFDLLGEPHTR